MSDVDFFNRKYVEDKYVWGEEPSEIAKIAAKNLKGTEGLKLLDVGCGYGRDALDLSQTLDCEVTGVDTSKTGITLGREFLEDCSSVELLEQDFLQITETYDAVIVSHVYHLLHPQQRKPFVSQIGKVLRPGGRFFLSAHSINDQAEYGKGKRVKDEVNSFVNDTYVHFSTKEELAKVFAEFKIDLYEHSFLEKRVGGDHHHTVWIVIGKKDS